MDAINLSKYQDRTYLELEIKETKENISNLQIELNKMMQLMLASDDRDKIYSLSYAIQIVVYKISNAKTYLLGLEKELNND